MAVLMAHPRLTNITSTLTLEGTPDPMDLTLVHLLVYPLVHHLVYHLVHQVVHQDNKDLQDPKELLEHLHTVVIHLHHHLSIR